MTAFSGRLAEQPLARVLARVLSGGRSGGLKVTRAAVTRQLFIEKGRIIRYAASNLMAESVTEHLKQQGRFQAEAMRKATSEKQEGELLTSTLLRQGFLTPEEHQLLVREMIEKVVVAMSRAADASFAYQDGELPFTQPGDAGVPVPVAILGLTRHASDVALLRQTLGERNLKVRLNPDPPFPMAQIPLDPTEGFLVSRADGELTLREIAVLSPLGPEETDRALCGLILAGVLLLDGPASGSPEVEPPGPPGERALHRESPPSPAAPPATPRAARPAGPVEEVLSRFAALEGQNYYQVLGIGSGASESEVRQSYYSLAKRLHPDKFSDEETKIRAEKLFAAVTEAYATLSKKESRSEYDANQIKVNEKPSAESMAASAAELARQNFLHGKGLFERGELVKALPFFEHAVKQDPSREEYFRYLGLVQTRNPRLRREAEQSLLRAIELNPTFADNYAQLGLLYRRIGQEEKAIEFLRQALSWDPTNETAHGTLDPEAGKKGLLKGLFHK